ncbi:MAG: alpha/beta hydrolase [Myxococcales bacterium]
MAERTLAERLQFEGARGLLSRLSPYSQRVLPAHTRLVDGLALSPDLQLMLALRPVTGGKAWHEVSVKHARAMMRRESRLSAGPKLQVGPVRTFEIPGAAGPMRVRHYVSSELGVRPLLVFFHGGGFLFGDLDTHDQPCRYLAKYAGVHVLSVEYRLAPEHPFPAGLEDAYAGYLWALENAAALGADPAQILVGGDSAGGNLAAVVSQLAKQNQKPLPVLQLLLYPAVDRVNPYRSLELFAEGFFLSRRDIDYTYKTYAPGSNPRDPRLGPIFAPDLSGLSPAFVVTAGFDPLRDEGEAYESALRKAGVTTRLHRVPDLIHGFINMTGLSPACEAALIGVADMTRNFLATLANRPKTRESA